METRPVRRRVLIWSAVGILLVALVVVGAIATKSRARSKKPDKPKTEAAAAAPVELSAVSRGRMVTWVQATAPLEALHSASLVARANGPVVAVLKEEGDWVEAGEVLARLDDKEARLAVERAELAADVAKREMDRGMQLETQGLTSAKDQDDLALKLRNAQVELEQARYNLSLTRITAPFAGRVCDRKIQLGETVNDGRECFMLADFHTLRARVYFPEKALDELRVGQEAELSLDTENGRTFKGRVVLVNPVVDRTNGTFKVTCELPNPSGTIRPGAFARVRIRTGDVADALLLPRRGVLSEDGEDYVFVARGDSVIRVPVHVGASENDTAQILSGLVAGDRVVTVGQGGLKPGARIRAVSL